MSRHQFEVYLDKVFDFSDKVAELPDGRLYPWHPWKKVFDAVGAHPVTGLWRSPLGGAKATVDDGDSSQDTANALAQGVKDSGGPATGYKAQEIDSTGAVTDLVAPAPA